MKIKKIICLLACLVFSNYCFGQISNMGSMYHLNRYLYNPAMAGVESGIDLNAGYKAQWVGVEDAPKVQSLSAVYGKDDKKFGLGLGLLNETAGLMRKTQFRGTYAYHIPLNRGIDFIDFGLTASFISAKLDMNRVKGSINDAAIGQFNERKAYFDSEFGAAYRSKIMTVQVALLSLKEIFDNNVEQPVLGTPTFYSALSFKLVNNDPLIIDSFEPILAIRNIKNLRTIVDLGVKADAFDKQFFMSAMYHSTKSFTFGIGGSFSQNFLVMGMYKTHTGAMGNYSNGEFEVGLQYKIKP